MRRSLIVGAAWLAVTAVSILVAYAAVGEVRNRVVDQPRLLPVAVSTVPSTTTSTMPTASTDAPAGPSTTLASTTTSTALPTTVTAGTNVTTGTVAVEGRIKTYSTPGGSVSIEVFSDRLRLLGAVPAAGFSVAEQEIAPTKIEVEFKSGTLEVHFHAALQSNGEVDVAVETENH